MNKSKKHIDELETWMQMMGSSNYMIKDGTDTIEIIPNHQTDSYHVFNEKRKAINEEISIGINGQTMTTFSGSSRSQSEVHLKTESEITDEDIKDVTDWFNNNFIVVMRNLGYDIPDGYYMDIAANTAMPIEDRATVDVKVSQMGFRLDKDYVEKTYNVVLDKTNPYTPAKSDPAPGGDPTQLSFFR